MLDVKVRKSSVQIPENSDGKDKGSNLVQAKDRRFFSKTFKHENLQDDTRPRWDDIQNQKVSFK